MGGGRLQGEAHGEAPGASRAPSFPSGVPSTPKPSATKSTPKQLCQGTNQKGQPCQRYALPGEVLCKKDLERASASGPLRDTFKSTPPPPGSTTFKSTPPPRGFTTPRQSQSQSRPEKMFSLFCRTPAAVTPPGKRRRRETSSCSGQGCVGAKD